MGVYGISGWPKYLFFADGSRAVQRHVAAPFKVFLRHGEQFDPDTFAARFCEDAKRWGNE